MIKWACYWKLLKQSFFGLLISCFILLGSSFVNWYTIQQVWLTSSPSENDSNYELTFLKWWGLMTNYLWYWKSVTAFNWSTFFWWAPNWLPYLYSNLRWVWQWFFNQFEVCSEIDWLDSVPWNCSTSSLTNDSIDILINFYSQIVAGDYVYYNTYSYSDNWWHWSTYFKICFSSSAVWKSMCFTDECNYNYVESCWSHLSNSQWYSDLTFSSIPRNSIWYAPWQAGYLWWWNIDWWSSEVVNSAITWDLMTSTCSKQRALDWYNRNWYSEKLCFASYNNNTDIFQGAWTVTAFALTWQYIHNVWQDTASYLRYWNTWSSMDYITWFQYWRNTFEVYQRNSDTYNNPFIWVPISIFTLMNNEYIYWKPFTNESILDYCNLITNNDLSSPYNWIYSSQICSQSLIDMVADTVWVHQESWQVVQWSSWDWITNRPWMHNPPVWNWWNSNTWSSSWSSGDSLDTYQDWVSFQNWFFNALKSNFKYPESSWNWFIPSYIIIFMCCLIFFRFISH